MEQILWEPVRMGPMTLPNRFVMPAMHLNFTMDGQVSQQLIDFYRARAEGGVGLIVVGGCPIDDVGGGFFMLQMSHDRFLPGLTRFCEEVKADVETRLCAQLFHAGRYAFSRFTQKQPVAPSALASRYNPEEPRAMSLEDIAATQQAFVDAAKRAAAAGFDAVELIGSAGYLIAEFLSPAANQRDDEYGGTLENRARFGVEAIQIVKAAVGDDLAVLIRVAGHDFVPGGHTNVEAAQAAALFEAAGVDGINVTGGWHESRVPQITMGVPEGAYSYLAAGIKRAVKVPVVASNRLGDPILAAQVIANGDADCIAMGRPLIADPQLPAKAAAGVDHAIRPCIACNQGCFDRLFAGRPVACMLNAQVGFEKKRALVPTEGWKKVVVVGAGPGGIEAARVADTRGHKVVLFELEPMIGGALWYCGSPPGRGDFLRYIEYLGVELEMSNIDLRLETEADVETVRAEDPDLVVVATGSEPIIPDLYSDATHPNVLLAEEVLGGQAILDGDVVVVGGGSVGVETALKIAHGDTIAPDVAAFLLATGAETPERVKELLTTPRRSIQVCDLIRLSAFCEQLRERFGQL